MIPAPFRLELTGQAAWTDYNNHLTESAYLLAFGEGSDAFFRFCGVDDAYRASGFSLYTVETHLRNLREARAGDPLVLTLTVLGADAKRLHILHEMYGDGLLATAEQMLLHCDVRAGRAAPFPPPLAALLASIVSAHAGLPRPACLCPRIGIPEER